MAHETNRTRAFHEKFVDPNTDGGKTALKCRDRLTCIRGHLEYTYYRIKDRSDCPSTCCLNKHFTDADKKDIERIDDHEKTSCNY